MDAKSVLVISRDATVAALLAAMLELAGFIPTVARGGESPHDAIARSNAQMIIVDCDDPQACGEEFMEQARLEGRRPILFSPSRAPEQVRALAAGIGVPWFTFPITRTQLADLVRSVGRGERACG